MACGAHTCAQRCHDGACGECEAVAEGPCRCGRSKSLRGLCRDGQLLCERRCPLSRSCGRHACKKRCCAAGEGCAPCREACGRALACGNCTCAAYCHAGECSACPLTRTVACACGGTTVAVPCGRERGAAPPRCALPCKAPADCLHVARAPHKCHAGPCPPCSLPCGRVHARCGHECPEPCHDDPGAAGRSTGSAAPTACPPCSVPVRRRCVGGHSEVQAHCSAPALFACSAACGRALPCAKHECGRTCHGGDCASSCGRSCGEPRPALCTHACAKASCHEGPCPPCRVAVPRRCFCGAAATSRSCEEERAARAAGGGASVGGGGAPLSAGFSCGARCQRFRRDCGHMCAQHCHDGTCEAEPCAKGNVVRCGCGVRKEPWPCDRVVAERAALGAIKAPPGSLTLLKCDGEGSPCRVAATAAAAAAAAAARPALAAEEAAAEAEAEAEAEGAQQRASGAGAVPHDEVRRRRQQRRAEEVEAAMLAMAEKEAVRAAAAALAAKAAAAREAEAAALAALSKKRWAVAGACCLAVAAVLAGLLLFLAFFAGR